MSLETPVSRGPLAKLFAKYIVDATVSAAEMVTPSLRRICLVADAPIAFPYAPGQHVRVQILDPLSLSGILRPFETLRTYTIWDFAPDRRSLELRAHLYEGNGIGVRWAREVKPADRVTFWWPEGDFFTREAPYHLFIGEETASAAFGPMLRALGASAQVYGVLESESPEHCDWPLRSVRSGPRGSAAENFVRGAAPVTTFERR